MALKSLGDRQIQRLWTKDWEIEGRRLGTGKETSKGTIGDRIGNRQKRWCFKV